MTEAMQEPDVQEITPGKGKAKKRMVLFRASDAPPPPYEIPLEGLTEVDHAHIGKMMELGAAVPGEEIRVVFEEPGEDGMSLTYVWFKSGYVLPRHSHNADCLYYILAGEIHMGSQVLKKGEGFFIPSDGAYTYEAGPEGTEVLEFRNSKRFNLVMHNNDAAHWDRMISARLKGAEKWPSETAPSV